MTDSLWPLPEEESADAEAFLIQIPVQIAQIEQTLNQAKVHLAALRSASPRLREILTRTGPQKDRPQLADLQAAQELRVVLIKAALESVVASQSAAKYLQVRERSLSPRRDCPPRLVIKQRLK